MKQRTNLRGYVGLAVALFITLVADALAVVLGAPWRIVLGWQPFQPFWYLPYCWAKIGNLLALNWLLGARTRLYRQYQPRQPRPNEVTIIICNHPPTTLLFSFCRFVFTNIASRVVIVGKIEHIRSWYAPLFGWGVWGAQSGVFINRKKREQALRVLRGAITKMRKWGSRTFVIFPDQHRPTPKRIADDLAHYNSKIPNLASWLKNILVPRLGGFIELLEACDRLRLPIRVVDITCWSSRPSQNVWQAGALVNATIWLDVQEHDGADFPRDSAALKQHLNQLWEKKNRLIVENSDPAV